MSEQDEQLTLQELIAELEGIMKAGWNTHLEWLALGFLKAYATTAASREQERRAKPKIICFCGSTRFTDVMLVKQWELTKLGYITLSWCALPEWYFKGDHIGDVEGVKEIVDELHLRKIDLADGVFVINVGGYIGESTSREIAYAERTGKPIRYLEPVARRAESEGER